jgi:Protein of unknown function (DUF3302)
VDALSYFALAILIFVILTLAYGMIIIHDIPYHIAKAQDHPHQDAIHAAGWVSLFTLHAIWPFLWIWATIYRPERGGDLVLPQGWRLLAGVEALPASSCAVGPQDSSSPS